MWPSARGPHGVEPDRAQTCRGEAGPGGPRPGYLRRRGNPRGPLEFQEHETIGPRSGPGPAVFSLDNAGESVDVHIRPRLAVDDIDSVHEAARRGIGIALLPEFACREDLQAGRLRC
jgi:DNA-binding transcriptional LysR family regulator